MIRDSAALADARSEWAAVRAWEGKIGSGLLATFALGGVPAPGIVDEAAHSILLLFAFGAFERILRQLADEGVFSTKSSKLGALMHASRQSLPWQDFAAIDGARNERNQIAHHQKTLARGECWKHLHAMERELIAWKIIEKPTYFAWRRPPAAGSPPV